MPVKIENTQKRIKKDETKMNLKELIK
jgi:hypothetical protein